ERSEDIPLLARSILQDNRGPDGMNYHLTESAVSVLKAHRYRGNIRELRNILSRATILANTNVIDQELIRRSLGEGAAGAGDRAQPGREPSLKQLELDYLRQLMRSHDNDRETVAAIAGISVRSLYRKLE
ncbi:MAG: AAA family ATPase, partial [Halieaceae bacterium]|nr:AAA family ATPase [Halieaceae bacterium]